MEIFGAKSFAYNTSTTHFPFAKGTTTDNNVVYLMIKDTTQAIGILKNKKFGGGKNSRYTRYFKPKAYNAKIFSKTIKRKTLPSEIKDLRASISNIGMVYFNDIHPINKKNVVVDLSTFNEAFFNAIEGKNMKLIATMYIEYLKKYIETYCPKDHPNKFIVLNIEDWHISRDTLAKTTSSMNKHLNPISILYYLMKFDIKGLEPLEGYQFVILDGESGWMTFKMVDIDDMSFNKLYSGLKKFKTDTAIEDDDEIDSKIEIIDKDIESEPKEVEDPDNEDDDETEIMTDDGIVVSQSAKAAIKNAIGEDNDDYDDKLLKAAEEIKVDSETAERSAVSNARDKYLREQQKKIRIDNISLGDLDEQIEKANKIDYSIEEDDLSSKIFAPKANINKIRFDNFNKSYVKKVMKKDLVSVFNSLKNRTHPVYIRNIKIEDTSTEMDLKETWHIALEGSDRVRHSVTIDIPKVYDNDYFFLGGNRKQFVNQLFLKPVVKIAPDTVQICTNYNKIFMYRYGEILSPKVTIFKKIISNNPKYFKCKRGNGTALTNKHKSSIEYDSLAKDFVDIEIRGTGFHMRFDQKFFDGEVKAGNISEISDDYLYCFFDSRKKNKDPLRAIPVNIERDSDGRDGDDNDDGSSSSIIDVFADCFKKETGKDFWELAGPKDKAGKRFMYTRCKVMKKFVPTVILCAYFEGLTTAMNKAGIKYRFTDKRAHITHGEGMIEFADGYLIYDREPTDKSLFMNGLSVISTKNYEYAEFDKKDVYLDIFDVLYNSRILGVALNSYYDNMIDPKTYEYLKKYNYPTDIVSLIIFASKLLADNNHENELDMGIYRLRNMEMIYAYLYKIIAHAYSDYERTAMNKNPVKISVPKNELIKTILTSNVLEDYSIINPITEKEKLHTASIKGPSGMNLARGMTEAKRCYDKSMTGLIGITTSPDMNVGVQRELTIEPKILDSFGSIDLSKKNNEMNDMNLFTYAEQLTPNGVMYDDAIR
jgi:hypothetical protein